jgi:hypothetical protein
MWFDNVDDAVQNFERPHYGEGYMDSLEPGVHMATGGMERIVRFLRRIEIGRRRNTLSHRKC